MLIRPLVSPPAPGQRGQDRKERKVSRNVGVWALGLGITNRWWQWVGGGERDWEPNWAREAALGQRGRDRGFDHEVGCISGRGGVFGRWRRFGVEICVRRHC
jgi:hypothetical protein